MWHRMRIVAAIASAVVLLARLSWRWNAAAVAAEPGRRVAPVSGGTPTFDGATGGKGLAGAFRYNLYQRCRAGEGGPHTLDEALRPFIRSTAGGVSVA